MADELVEAVAMQLCRAGGYGLCVGFCHSKRCTEAIENYGHVARAIIPLVREAERADVVKWLRQPERKSLIPMPDTVIPEYWDEEAEFWVPERRHKMSRLPSANDFADAIAAGEHTQESQP